MPAVQEEYAITNQVNAFATQGSPDLDVKQPLVPMIVQEMEIAKMEYAFVNQDSQMLIAHK